MSFSKSFSVAVTTDGSGDATQYTRAVSGAIRAVRYVPDPSTPLDTGADLTMTLETTGHTVLVQSNIGTTAFSRYPRVNVHDAADGGAALYASAGEPVTDVLYAAEERVKVVIANGGNALSGTFIITVG